jgi:L,D-transpeptidase YcbB
VFYTGDGRAREIDPRLVDWRAWNGRSLPFHFRQVPSEVNALGKVKFMFPNEHAVYLHDTPTRNLFSRSVRMFSSGCVRVEHPVDFADALLALEADLDGARVERLIAGGRNGTAPLKRHVPVHLTYFTVWVDETGEVQLRDDVYGHDEKLKSLLGLADAEST